MPARLKARKGAVRINIIFKGGSDQYPARWSVESRQMSSTLSNQKVCINLFSFKNEERENKWKEGRKARKFHTIRYSSIAEELIQLFDNNLTEPKERLRALIWARFLRNKS